MARVDEDQLAAVERSERAELERRAARVFEAAVLARRSSGQSYASSSTTASPRARRPGPHVRSRASPRCVSGDPGRAGRSPSTLVSLADAADEVICLATPESFLAVGQLYRDFSQTSDEEVVALLRRAAGGAAAHPVAAGAADPPVRDEEVEVRLWSRPPRRSPHYSRGVLWAGRLRPRQRERPSQPAEPLCRGRIEFGRARDPPLRSPHPRGGSRSGGGLRHRAVGRSARSRYAVARGQPEAKGSRIGYFGASTGAGAALVGSRSARIVDRCHRLSRRSP